MSPEQAGGPSQMVGPASDLYSLGALLYHLLTRQPPFQADTLTTLLKQVVEAEPVAPRLLNPSIPRDLETICLKCLEKEPARRYPTGQALADDLGRFLEDRPIQARPVGPAGKAWKWCRRRPAMAGVTAALVVTFGLGFGGIFWQWSRARQHAQAELEQRRRAQAGEQSARYNAYAADMRLAQLAIANNNRALAVSLLDKHRPNSAPPSILNSQPFTDLRGWEWRYLWQLCQGEEQSTLHRFPSPVRALAVSKDGDLLAVATCDEVVLWDLERMQRLTLLSRGAPTTLAFSPVDTTLAVGTWNAQGQPVVDLWNVTGAGTEKKRTFIVGNHSLAFSPDSQRLAILDASGRLTIAGCASGSKIAEFAVLPVRDRGSGVVIFLQDEDSLAIGQEYGSLRLLDLKSKTFTPLETQTTSCITALVFSPASGLLAAGFGWGEGTIRLWHAGSGELRAQLTHHTNDVTALAFTPDGRALVSAGADWTIRTWSLAEHTQSRRFQSAREGPTALALLPDGRLVSGGSSGSVCFWNLTNSAESLTHTNLALSLGFQPMREIPPEGWMAGPSFDSRTGLRFGLAFTPDARSFITLDTNGTLVRWQRDRDARAWQPAETLLALGTNHWGLALSPDSRWLATGDLPGSIAFYGGAPWRAVTNFSIPFEWLGLLRFSRNGHYFIGHAGLNNGKSTVRMWRTGDWAEVPLTDSQFQGLEYPALDVSPDDRFLAVGYGSGALRLFRLPSLALEHEFNLGKSKAMLSAVLFSPDGRELVSAGFDGSVRIWDVATRLEKGAPLLGHRGPITGAAFAPDGRRLVTGGKNATEAVKLWDLVSRREILSLEGEGIFFTHLVFSPDGNTLAAASMSGTAHLWHAPAWEEISEVESKQNQQ